MRTHFTKALFLLSAAIACGGSESISPLPAPPLAPALESVNFALLGSGKVAFERIGPAATPYNVIYVVDATAGHSSQLLDNTVTWGSALSPDGKRVAYGAYSTLGNKWDVYVANVDGTARSKITHFFSQGPPSWTADGARIVVASSPSSGSIFDVWSQSAVATGADLTQHTHFSTPPGGSVTCPIIMDATSKVSVSAQGLLAFACFTADIDVLSASGTLLSSYQPPRVDLQHWPNVFAPEWSPDGTKIAFIETTSNRDAGLLVSTYALRVMNADATNLTTLASVSLPPGAMVQAGGGWSGPNNMSVCWMPDGSRLVFVIPESTLVGHIWVVRADGTGLAQLTSAPGVYDRSVSCSAG